MNVILVEVNFSCWSAKTTDRKAGKEITMSKGANSVDAAKVQKNLLAGLNNLKKITDFVAIARNEFYKSTLPWSDSGQRLIPMAQFFDLKQWVNNTEIEFSSLVQTFLHEYPNLIAAQAFQLGQLFDRNEYPTVDEVKEKFRFRVAFLPLPDSGDFRVDAPQEALDEMAAQYEVVMKERVSKVSDELWGRLRNCLEHMSERLSSNPDGTKKIFRGSLINNAIDECDMIQKLNVTGDAKIEKARAMLENAIAGLDADMLRESDVVRVEVKKKVDDVLTSWM